MDELRLVRREDQSLIVATETGEEFRLVVDETVLAELRHLSRAPRGAVRANPREVQALVRAGKTREEIMQATGLEESDIQRYEEPVLAERRYVLERAHAVAVRTSPGDEVEQQFGAVIAERLVGLGAVGPEWSSWRDEEAGWMIGLDFSANDDTHRAVWSFDHRKSVLAPLTPDAESLSKQGTVGDRLIPKLRAVEAEERFDSGAFDPDRLVGDFGPDAAQAPVNISGPVAPDHPSTGSIPIIDMEAEYARQQSIEDRAIKSPAPELPDLGQTADLLDALRRRRGERDAAERRTDPVDSGDDASRFGDDAGRTHGAAPVTPIGGTHEPSPSGDDPDDADATAEVVPFATPTRAESTPSDALGDQGRRDRASEDTDSAPEPEPKQPLGPASEKSNRRGKGRASIPSWDDILFGTRSEDDPA